MNHPTTAGTVRAYPVQASTVHIGKNATIQIGEGMEVTILLAKGARVRIEEAGE